MPELKGDIGGMGRWPIRAMRRVSASGLWAELAFLGPVLVHLFTEDEVGEGLAAGLRHVAEATGSLIGQTWRIAQRGRPDGNGHNRVNGGDQAAGRRSARP